MKIVPPSLICILLCLLLSTRVCNAQTNISDSKNYDIFLKGVVGYNITKKVLLDTSTVIICTNVSGIKGTNCTVYFSGRGFESVLTTSANIGHSLASVTNLTGTSERIATGTKITIDPVPVKDKNTGKYINLRGIVYTVID